MTKKGEKFLQKAQLGIDVAENTCKKMRGNFIGSDDYLRRDECWK